MNDTMKVVLPNGKTAKAIYRSSGSRSVYVRMATVNPEYPSNKLKLTTISGKIVPGVNGRLPRFVPNENGKNAHLVGGA